MALNETEKALARTATYFGGGSTWGTEDDGL